MGDWSTWVNLVFGLFGVLGVLFGVWAWYRPREGTLDVDIKETPVGLPNDSRIEVIYDGNCVPSPVLITIRMANYQSIPVEYVPAPHRTLEFIGDAPIVGVVEDQSYELVHPSNEDRPTYMGFRPAAFTLRKGGMIEYTLIADGEPNMSCRANLPGASVVTSNATANDRISTRWITQFIVSIALLGAAVATVARSPFDGTNLLSGLAMTITSAAILFWMMNRSERREWGYALRRPTRWQKTSDPTKEARPGTE